MTLAYSLSRNVSGQTEIYPAAITSTTDTTATVYGTVISNTDGRLSYIGLQYASTAASGTSPTLTLSLQGSNDGTNWVDLTDSAGNAITTAALALTSTSTTFVDSVAKPRSTFPAHLRPKYVLGGTTPNQTGVVSLVIKRAG